MKNSLSHYGKLGMRWGRRQGKTKQDVSSHEHLMTQRLKQKKLKELSNDELKQLTGRLELEKRYKQLNPDKIQKGKNVISDIFKGIGALAGVAGSIAGLAAIGEKIMKAKG